ncbi:MAG: RsmE family RNA methyltransferase [Simkania negevensis]|nr:RsmE family RNA methyltransferase [Simkania negevensis]
MPQDRYFIENPLQKNTKISLEKETLHKLRSVMRKREGETVELINGKGILAIGVIEKLTSNKGTLSIESYKEEQLPPPSLIAVEPFLKLPALELVIKKGTELGVQQFWLFPAERSEKEIVSFHQLKRLRAITISAIEQCGRLDLPEILMQPPLKKIEFRKGSLFFGDLRKKAFPFQEIAPKISTYPKPLFLLCGPEKGWSDEELSYLDQKTNGVGIKLHGKSTLRAETAAIATFAFFAEFMELQKSL